MLTQTIRRQFLHYFKERGHAIIPSSPVVPHDDPTLFFTNAGMNQFKDVFLGKAVRDYTAGQPPAKNASASAANTTTWKMSATPRRHLTFFEMLGNFSFGDYFKKEAIQFAWEVSTKYFGFDPDTSGPPSSAKMMKPLNYGRAMSRQERIIRFGEKDNFWAMGDTGPCGPCSELYYDRGPKYRQSYKTQMKILAGERFLEFWNLVFMQYNTLQLRELWNPFPSPRSIPEPALNGSISSENGCRQRL